MVSEILYSGPAVGFFDRDEFISYMSSLVGRHVEVISQHYFEDPSSAAKATLFFYRITTGRSVIRYRHSMCFRGHSYADLASVLRCGEKELTEVELEIVMQAARLAGDRPV